MAWILPLRREDLINHADLDGDGNVTSGERGQAGALFDGVDRDRDGIATDDEFRTFASDVANDTLHAFNEAVVSSTAHFVSTMAGLRVSGLSRLQGYFHTSTWSAREYDLVVARLAKMSSRQSFFLVSQQNNPHTVEELARRGIAPSEYLGNSTPEAARLYLHFHGKDAPEQEIKSMLQKHHELQRDVALVTRFAAKPWLLEQFHDDAVQSIPSAWRNLRAFRACTPKERGSMDRELLARNRYALRDEIPGEPRHRKTAVVLYPTADHNGAFNRTPVSALTRYGFNVLFYDMESDRDIERFLKEASHDGRNPVDLVVFGGHGSPTGMQVSPGFFGLGLTDRSMFDTSDLVRLKMKGVQRYVASGANVVLHSCSTGRGGQLPLPLNMVTSLWSIFGKKVHVWAPSRTSSSGYHSRMAVDADGNMSHPGIGFSGREGEIIHIEPKD